MNSIKCPECGFVGWADAERCKKCGVLYLHEPSDSAMASPSYRDYQPGYRSSSTGELKTGLAVASLVMGILGFFTFGLLGIGAIVGLILAIVAMNRAKRNPEVYGGSGLAIAGLVTNLLCVVTIVPILIIAAIAIPNLLAARRAANEAASIATLRRIHSAQATYQATRGNGSYGTLEDLTGGGGSEPLLDPSFSSGTRFGYKFTVEPNVSRLDSSPGFEAVAVPVEYGNTGIRSFYVDETGVIRGENNRGALATALSPPLDDDSYSAGSSPRRRNRSVSEY